MRGLWTRFVGDESAATAIEYGLIAAMIAAAMITGLTELGNNLNSQMIAIGTHLN